MGERRRLGVFLHTGTCEVYAHAVSRDGCSAETPMHNELSVQFLVQCMCCLYRTALNDNIDIDYFHTERRIAYKTTDKIRAKR